MQTPRLQRARPASTAVRIASSRLAVVSLVKWALSGRSANRDASSTSTSSRAAIARRRRQVCAATDWKRVRKCDIGDFDVIRSFPFVTLVLIPFLIAVCWSRRRSSTEADADAAAGGHTPIVILNANINDAMTPPTVPSLAQLPPPPGASPDTVVVMGPTGSFNVGVPEAVPAN